MESLPCRASWIGAATAALLLVTSGPARTEVSAKKQSFETYRMLRTRNIFDPNRQANTSSASAKDAATAATPASTADFVALTGIMINADKALAFFSGSRQDYNKVLPVSSQIAGATITKITPVDIEVERAGKRITIAIGQTVPFDGSAPTAAPVIPSATASTLSSNPTSTPANAGPGTSSPAAPASNREAILRRMMERRQQELK